MVETTNRTGLRAAEVARELASCRAETFALLDRLNTQDAQTRRVNLATALEEHDARAVLSIALVGQYSAGKSTIVSALTGRRDVRIDADIATDRTSAYGWNGVELVDTPGLFTERADHDATTYEAISRADLLAFCLTYMLFDSITIGNFCKLAYEQGYRGKILLLVNKLSGEAGDVETRISTYERSIADSLQPHELSDFPRVFIDARDYVEGIDEGDDYLVRESRFPTLIDALNRFTEEQGMLARIETPALILRRHLDEVERQILPDGPGDAAYLELLDRLERKVRNVRERLRLGAKRIALDYSAKVAGQGTMLARTLGTEEYEAMAKTAQQGVEEDSKLACDQLNGLIEQMREEVRLEVERILNSDLANAVADRLGVGSEVRQSNIAGVEQLAEWRERVGHLEAIGKEAGVHVTRLATDSGRAAAQASSGFLSASQVAGSSLHQGVYAVGKFFNYSFGPWQAVNIAKNIANVTKVLGPLMTVAGVALEVYQARQETKREEEIAQGRREIVGQFHAMGREMEAHIEKTLRTEVEPRVFNILETRVADARQKRTADASQSNENLATVQDLRSRLRLLLDAPSGKVL